MNDNEKGIGKEVRGTSCGLLNDNMLGNEGKLPYLQTSVPAKN